ncbi:MAG: L-fuculokinase [Bacteroidetes bacterium]|nr:L-fuculokinase [Bacteroidota bacterium]
MEKAVLVFDCGATNLRVIAMGPHGEILAARSFASQTCNDPFHKGGRIWDLDEIWARLCTASKEVVSMIPRHSIAAVTTTSFGVDGSFLNSRGKLLYPVISWQCDRTVPVMQHIGKYISLSELYGISGINAYSFNTINKLVWFKENLPQIPEEAECFLFMPSLINYKLTGARINDATMLGTSMLTSLKTRALSQEILGSIGYRPDLFATTGEAGDIVGHITPGASDQTGIPPGTMVCLAGHDTQFAVFGSGAGVDQPVLSSGTWEILMARSRQFSATETQFDSGITTEFDSFPGLYDIGVNWLGSGIVEWIKNRFFPEYSAGEGYEVMIAEAIQAGVGANGIFINPDFNNFRNTAVKGQISGLSLNSNRGEIIRAAFEALSFQTKNALESLENAGNFKAAKIICVGGGSKNKLWNQIRADVLNLPVDTISQKETTALGASFFAFAAAGVFVSPEEAKAAVDYHPQTTLPSENNEQYNNLYYQWKRSISQK